MDATVALKPAAASIGGIDFPIQAIDVALRKGAWLNDRHKYIDTCEGKILELINDFGIEKTIAYVFFCIDFILLLNLLLLVLGNL